MAVEILADILREIEKLLFNVVAFAVTGAAYASALAAAGLIFGFSFVCGQEYGALPVASASHPRPRKRPPRSTDSQYRSLFQ
jgi:hypothetical protein